MNLNTCSGQMAAIFSFHSLTEPGYVVVEAFLFMSDELLDRRAAFLRPFFIEPTAEGYDLAIDQQDGRYLVREFRDDVSGLVVGLDAELFSVLAVLAEQEPCEPVEDRSFADAVAPVNLRERRSNSTVRSRSPLKLRSRISLIITVFICVELNVY